MSAIDSEIVFFARIEEIGLSKHLDAFKKKKWTTMATFAFATSELREPSAEVFNEEVLKPLFGSSSHEDAPQVRRLFMQAFGAAAAEMQQFSAPTSAPKPGLHPEDRRAALKRVREKLASAFTVAGSSEPSVRLIDLCFKIHRDEAVRYVAWEKCTSILEETKDPKCDEEPGLRLNADGTFNAARTQWTNTDTSGELLWELAMRKRGVAFDIAGVCVYEASQLWVEKLRASLAAPQVPGRLRISWAQIRAADEALSDYIARETATTGPRKLPGEVVTQFQKQAGGRHHTPRRVPASPATAIRTALRQRRWKGLFIIFLTSWRCQHQPQRTR